MTFKQHSLIALIGIIILVFCNLYVVINFGCNVVFAYYHQIPLSYIIDCMADILGMIGHILIMIFFLKLYTQQKDLL